MSTLPFAVWTGTGNAYGKNTWMDGTAKTSLGPNQTISIMSGTMNIPGGSLFGNVLEIGNGPFAPIKFTLNLSAGADVQLMTSIQEDNPYYFTGATKFTINVSGTDTLNIVNNPTSTHAEMMSPTFANDATFNLAKNANLVSNDQMWFGSLTVNGVGATDTFNWTSNFMNTAVLLNTNVAGSGTLILNGTSAMVIDGNVSSGTNIQVYSNQGPKQQASLTIDHLNEFKGSVTLGGVGPASTEGLNAVLLAGVNANSYSLKGDILSLFSANKLVGSLTLKNWTQSNTAASTNNMVGLQIEHSSAGVVIETKGDSFHNGTALSVHT